MLSFNELYPDFMHFYSYFKNINQEREMLERNDGGERVFIDLDDDGEDININNDILNIGKQQNLNKGPLNKDRDPLNK